MLDLIGTTGIETLTKREKGTWSDIDQSLILITCVEVGIYILEIILHTFNSHLIDPDHRQPSAHEPSPVSLAEYATPSAPPSPSTPHTRHPHVCYWHYRVKTDHRAASLPHHHHQLASNSTQSEVHWILHSCCDFVDSKARTRLMCKGCRLGDA